MPSAHVSDYSSLALQVVRALAGRDYSTAYAMTSSDYQRSTTLEKMRAAFEAIVPPEWPTVGPVQVGHVMEIWPTKEPNAVGVCPGSGRGRRNGPLLPNCWSDARLGQPVWPPLGFRHL